jgi:hypothetical protein
MPYVRSLEWRSLRLEGQPTRLVWLGVIPIAAVLALILTDVIDTPLRDTATPPDLALLVQGVSHPMVSVQNRSATVARDVGVHVTIWDLDDRANLSAADPGALFNPVFPTGSVHPGSAAGPWALSSVTGRLTQGHVVFGHASVQCNDCGKPRAYWLSLRVGHSGWTKEFSPAATPAAPLLTRVLLAGGNYSNVLDELIPKSERTPILD